MLLLNATPCLKSGKLDVQMASQLRCTEIYVGRPCWAAVLSGPARGQHPVIKQPASLKANNMRPMLQDQRPETEKEASVRLTDLQPLQEGSLVGEECLGVRAWLDHAGWAAREAACKHQQHTRTGNAPPSVAGHGDAADFPQSKKALGASC
mgnify:CR=1 FL=1